MAMPYMCTNVSARGKYKEAAVEDSAEHVTLEFLPRTDRLHASTQCEKNIAHLQERRKEGLVIHDK